MRAKKNPSLPSSVSLNPRPRVPPLLALAVLLGGPALAACGSSAQDFVGLWSVAGTAALQVTVGQEQASQTVQLGGNWSIVESAEGDDTILIATSGCNVPAKVKGDVATIPAGLTCTGANGGSETWRSGTFVFNDGSTMSHTATSEVRFIIDGVSGYGTGTTTATLTKVGK